eukprot:COSAG06_NODE_245_length_19176_cov_167.625151_26_plen_72_part_01
MILPRERQETKGWGIRWHWACASLVAGLRLLLSRHLGGGGGGGGGGPPAAHHRAPRRARAVGFPPPPPPPAG